MGQPLVNSLLLEAWGCGPFLMSFWWLRGTLDLLMDLPIYTDLEIVLFLLLWADCVCTAF